MQYRHLVFALLFILSVLNVNAAGYVKAKYAGEFMATGVDARALGMGGAFVAVAEDASAGYWNPAGLASLEYPQIIGMYAEQFDRIVNFNYGAVAGPSGERSSLGIGFIRLGVDDIPYTGLRNPDLELGAEYTEDGVLMRNLPYVVRTVNDAEWAFYFTYAKISTERLAWGVNIKTVAKTVGDNSAWGLGFDFGARYNLWPNTIVAANLQDITTTMLAWDTGRREAITPTVKVGAAHYFNIPLIAGKLIPALDLDFRFENRGFASKISFATISIDSHVGLEYSFKDRLALRAGIPDVGKFTAGAGIRLPQLNIDYAFLAHDELGDTHRISVRLAFEEGRFGRSRFKQKK
ncbi:PorV/PorQ family protein [candidate division KSB1 bacterium]|nr:PorV/PorQ family protein [candidate division KSB1 bacterium]